jgi:HAE1 family hydrophobic/amphiphilic exporter-1
MTAIATICALLPMALGLTGSGGFIGQPLAIVVIGGLLSSTLLTLVLVPTLYTMVERTKERFGMQPQQHPRVGSVQPAASGDGRAAPPVPVSAIYSKTEQFEVLRRSHTRQAPPQS